MMKTDWRGAFKGEGIVIGNSAQYSGKGARATGGGGGNDHNSGGGGGGHATAGGQGGENDEPSLFGCSGENPGLGGKAIADFQGYRLFFGWRRGSRACE